MNEAIILAGGLGTRLRDTVPELPKSMAPVAGRPFISYVIDHLRIQGIKRIILSLGYRSEIISDYIKKQYPTLDYVEVVEEEPLGTGGAILLALQKATEENVVITNGDTLFRVNLEKMEEMHVEKSAECTLALKPMKDFERYGVVETAADGRITSFSEKKYYSGGHINGGTYILNRTEFLARHFPVKFSFEQDYLEKNFKQAKFYASIQDGYFIDIGIPGDFHQAGIDLSRSPLNLKLINKEWTLFLDRDGVINDERVGYYVKNWGEFIFSKGVLEIFQKLSEHFGRIIIVSNQRGVGKGLMSESDLQSIHLEMQREVEIAGGRIDRIYYCTEKEDTCFFRKPNPGMAYRAYKDFPEIEPSKSIMVGNKPGDMKFGRSAGMHTVFVKTTNPEQEFPHPDIDLMFPGLFEFASALES